MTSRRSPGPGSRARRRRRWGTVLLVLAVLTALPGAALLLLGAVPDLQRLHLLATQAAAFVHFGVVAWFVALVLGLIALAVRRGAGRRALAAVFTTVCAAGLATQTLWLAPLFTADVSLTQGESVVVLSLNVEFGAEGDEIDAVLTLARDEGADVVMLQETTAETITGLRAAGFDDDFPHRIGDGESGATGTVIASRFPLTQIALVETALESRIVRAQTPNGDLVIGGVHPMPPVGNVDRWSDEAATLRAALQPYLGGDLVVAGDFNAIDRHAPMLDLAADGLRSAADLAGAGYAPTWPDDRGLPALVGIDHVLVSASLTAVRFSTHSVPGTDHRAVVAEIVPLAQP